MAAAFVQLTVYVALGFLLMMSGAVATGQAFPSDALYFISSRDGNYRIYATDLMRNVTRMLHNQPVGYDIVLSPDGSRIAFVGTAQHMAALYVLDWDGKNLRIISQPAEKRQGNPLWSPDSRQLAFTLSDKEGVEIYSVNADGSDRQVLAIDDRESDKELLAWSRDGKQIMFRINNNRESAIRVIQSDGNQSTLAVIKGLTATSAQWSPDGR